MKIKVSESWGRCEDRDLHRTASARHVMGEAAELHFDANGGYTRKQAVRMAAAMTRPAHGRPPGRCPPTRAWQQRVQVVAGHPSGDVEVALAHPLGVLGSVFKRILPRAGMTRD
ncbi:hypothetical protein [Streptomyces chartreusis]|uniref:hypothetical protein n=1 Tax=Streptomyces chartreusis TaxID=1969 RepID=UPI0036BB11EE